MRASGGRGRADSRGRALVVGGTRGIGAAIALELGTAGYSVVIAGRDGEAGENLRGQLQAEGIEARFLRADVTSPSSVNSLTRFVSDLGPLDVAVNSAGLALRGLVVEQAEEDWSAVIETSLTGLWRCLRTQLRLMVEQGSGSVINVASIWGLRGRPGLSSYVAAKHGVVGLTKAAALEVAAAGVRVNAVCPGTTDTDMVRSLGSTDEDLEALAARYPMQRLVTPVDVARAVRWLASDEASFVTGECLVVDGGFSI